MTDMSSKTITFIGAGNMASSLISGLVADGYDPKKIIASDPDHNKLADLSARFGVQSAEDNHAAIMQAEVAVLAVKPQALEQVCRDIRETVQQRQPLLVSIAAGIREADIQTWLGGGVALVRSMPNTPAMLQTGATVLHAGNNVSGAQRDLAESILRAVGLTRWVDNEALMDVATALSGSGPAYYFLVMEAMEEAAIANGMAADTARLLTIQTALGAARMAIESSDSPAILRQKVTSPGGTTERALSILEKGELRALFEAAISGACERSRELSEMLGNH